LRFRCAFCFLFIFSCVCTLPDRFCTHNGSSVILESKTAWAWR
jgi:hypothetical protein